MVERKAPSHRFTSMGSSSSDKNAFDCLLLLEEEEEEEEDEEEEDNEDEIDEKNMPVTAYGCWTLASAKNPTTPDHPGCTMAGLETKRGERPHTVANTAEEAEAEEPEDNEDNEDEDSEGGGYETDDKDLKYGSQAGW